ncbi:MAG: hypothetical protein U1G07_25800 [Verrucomicrobiota bacterium]
MKTLHFDLIVLGSGFGGSLLSMVARQLGRSVLLLERGAHPRFAIGESSTPLANSLWEELSERYDLPRLRPLSKWGSWQQAYPEIGCGLKRGFSFFHHSAGQAFQSDAKRSNQLLVAASSRDEAADTHWYRPDFDHFLVREAQRLGVEYLDHCALQKVTFGPDSVSLEGPSGTGASSSQRAPSSSSTRPDRAARCIARWRYPKGGFLSCRRRKHCSAIFARFNGWKAWASPRVNQLRLTRSMMPPSTMFSRAVGSGSCVSTTG